MSEHCSNAHLPADHNNTDPRNLPGEVCRDPSLIGSNTTLVTSHQTEVIRIVDPVSEAEAEGEVDTESELDPLEEAAPKRRSLRKRPIASVALLDVGSCTLVDA